MIYEGRGQELQMGVKLHQADTARDRKSRAADDSEISSRREADIARRRRARATDDSEDFTKSR